MYYTLLYIGIIYLYMYICNVVSIHIYIYIYALLMEGNIKFHEALVPLVLVFSNPVMSLLLFEKSVNMHVCTSRAKNN